MVFLTIYVSEELGLGITFAANCFGVFGLGSIISSVVGGQLADRIGRKPTMLLALFGAATVLSLMSFTRDRYLFMGLVFVFSLAVELYRPAASAMIGDVTDRSQRPLAFGLMYIAFNLGFAVATPVGGLLAGYSYKLLFWGDALTTAGYGIIILLSIQESNPEGGRAASTLNAANGWMDSLRCLSRDVTFLLFSAATLLTSLVFMQAFTTLPIYLKRLGYTEQQVGLLLATNGILIVLCQIPITIALRRFHRILVIICGEVLISLGFGLTTFAETAPLLLLTIAVWTLGEVIQAAFKQSVVADLAPHNMRGRYMGIFSLCYAIGLTIGAPIGGRILDQSGPRVLWPTCFLVGILAATIYGFVFHRMQHFETASAEAVSS